MNLSLLFFGGSGKCHRAKLWHLRSPVHLPAVSLLEQERAYSYKLSRKVDKERLHTHTHTQQSNPQTHAYEAKTQQLQKWMY